MARDPVLAAIAAKAVKELTYHRDYAGRWFLTLAQGTEESRRRLLDGLAAVWPLYAELAAAYDAGPDVDVVLDQVFAVSGVERPDVLPMAGAGHTEALSRMLAEMQVVASARMIVEHHRAEAEGWRGQIARGVAAEWTWVTRLDSLRHHRAHFCGVGC